MDTLKQYNKKTHKVISIHNGMSNYLNIAFEKIASKEKSWKETIKPYAAPAIALTSAIAISMLSKGIADYGNKILRTSMEDSLSKNETVKNLDAIITKTKKIAGIPDVPHIKVKNFGNAAYIPPGSIPDYMVKSLSLKAKELIDIGDKHLKAQGKFLLKGIEFSKNKGGGIIIGDKFDNPAIVAHEIGHAVINHQGGISKIIQDWHGSAKQIGLAGASIGMITKMLKPDLGDYVFWGGLGTFGIGMMGQLYTEYLASKKAKGFLREQGLMNSNNENALNYALGTYGVSNVMKGLERVGHWGVMKTLIK